MEQIYEKQEKYTGFNSDGFIIYCFNQVSWFDQTVSSCGILWRDNRNRCFFCRNWDDDFIVWNDILCTVYFTFDYSHPTLS